jgi:predicted Fe-S protein YdhL (DUF1289 family)
VVNPVSPCVRNCCLNQQDICLGCYRSLEEITQWTLVSEQCKQDILAAADARREVPQSER